MARRFSKGRDYDAHPSDRDGLELVTLADETPRKLSPRQLARLAGLHVLGWRLYRARERRKSAERLEKQLKKRILKALPLYNIRGVIGGQKRRTRLLVVDVQGKELTATREFVDYLGSHANTVVTGVVMPLTQAISPYDVATLQALLSERFGDSLGDSVRLTYSADALKKLTTGKDRVLDPPPDHFFSPTGPPSQRVDAEPLS